MPAEFEGQPHIEGAEADAEKKLADFFEQNAKFFALYAGDSSMTAKPSRKLGTFAIDLAGGVLYGDPSYYEKKGLKESHVFNSFLHEFEHFRRLMTLVQEKDGLKNWQDYKNRMKAKPHLKVFDNILEDISVVRAILARAPSQSETQFDLYRTHLWPKRDLTESPRHMQFVSALFRETMMPDEPVEVADEVRAEIEKLRGMKNSAGQNLIDVMTNPDLPQGKRLALQEKYFEPVYERLFKKDVEEKKEEQKKAREEGEKQEGQQSGQPGEPQEGQEGGQPSEPQEGQPGEPQADPDDLFKDFYNEYFDKSPDAALDEKQVEEAVKKMIDAKGKPKSPEDLAAEAYAKEVGVSVEDLKKYQQFWSKVEELRSPESDETVVEEIRAAFRQIITERLEPVSRPKLPVEEGEYLVRPAEAVAEVRAGKTDPRVWMTYEVKEQAKELFGAFDVTVVCDRSGSMEETDGVSIKKVEQQIATALVLEALSEFCDDLEDKRKDMIADLCVRSEVWGFGGPPEVGCIKALSQELTDVQRVAVFKELANTPGKSTRDDLALEGIFASIPEEDWERIAKKELRKVVIVLTDGDSSNSEGAKAAIKKLRERGVVVVAIGITKAAKNALKLYKPDAHLAKTAAETGVAVGEVLKDFIKELN